MWGEDGEGNEDKCLPKADKALLLSQVRVNVDERTFSERKTGWLTY